MSAQMYFHFVPRRSQKCLTMETSNPYFSHARRIPSKERPLPSWNRATFGNCSMGGRPTGALDDCMGTVMVKVLPVCPGSTPSSSGCLVSTWIVPSIRCSSPKMILNPRPVPLCELDLVCACLKGSNNCGKKDDGTPNPVSLTVATRLPASISISSSI